MIPYAGAAFLVAGFVILFRAFRVLEGSKEAAAVAKRALGDLRDTELDDAEKERVLQRHSIRLFVIFSRLVLGGAGAIVLPAGVIWALDRSGVLSFDAVMEIATAWRFLLTSSLLVGVLLWRYERP